MCRCNYRCNSRNCRPTTCPRNNNCSRCTNFTNTCRCNMYENSLTENSVFPANYLYGHSYTPNQCMNKTFTPEIGLEHGTIFPELVSPYSPGQSIDFIEYLRNGGI